MCSTTWIGYGYIYTRWISSPVETTPTKYRRSSHLHRKENGWANGVRNAVSALSSVLDLCMGSTNGFAGVAALRMGANKARPGGPALETTWDILLLLKWLGAFGKERSTTAESDLPPSSGFCEILRFAEALPRWNQVEGNCCFVRFWRPKELWPGAGGTFRQWSRWVRVEKLAATKNTCTFRALKEWMRRTEDKAPEGGRRQTKKVLFFKLSSGIPTPLTSKDVAKFPVEALRKAGVPRVLTAHSGQVRPQARRRTICQRGDSRSRPVDQ